MCEPKIKEIAEEIMEVYYQRDRSTTDAMFKSIMDKQNTDSKKIDRLTKMMDSMVKLLNKVI